MRPLIALLTDFGLSDHYVGTMKGVVLGICPEATLVDITHDVPAHDVLDGAIQLAAAFKYFPAGTVFLGVVDPGVGSERRAIAAEAGDFRFVAPDNGLLTLALREAPPKRIVELTERRYARPTVSRTFEGRDRFAPASAWLAKGIELEALGRRVTDYLRLDVPVAQEEDGRVRGTILHTDRFGNLITNVDRATLERLTRTGAVEIRAGGRGIGRLVDTYAEIQPGEVCALLGSTDHLELAANGASAASLIGAGPGTGIEIVRVLMGADGC
jgi:S-adenosylmethionine hydrolase